MDSKAVKIAAVVGGTAFLLVVVALYKNERETVMFSNKAIVSDLWEHYKREYIEPNSGRTLDKDRGYITTSEGQSYTMLRAVWMDDKETFDRTWNWTKDNLDRPSDALLAWLFGKRKDGSYGIILEEGGTNSASDADTDAAMALIFAYSRWQNPTYLDSAVGMIKDIWAKEVVFVKGKPYLTAGTVNTESSILLNPSYFAPYAYRIFADVDRAHNWLSVVDTSYEVLGRSMDIPLDKKNAAGIPPDWVEMDRRTGDLRSAKRPELTTNYGYDAMRVPWRVGLDWQWYKDPQSKEVLDRLTLLSDEWEEKELLYSTYAHDGTVVLPHESPAMYGGSIGYFLVSDNGNAHELFARKLHTLYDPTARSWRTKLNYYDANFAWFGIALYSGSLPNLYLLNFR